MSLENEKICNVEDMNEVEKLSSEPTVTCSRCGARAHDPRNVCSPVTSTGS